MVARVYKVLYFFMIVMQTLYVLVCGSIIFTISYTLYIVLKGGISILHTKRGRSTHPSSFALRIRTSILHIIYKPRELVNNCYGVSPFFTDFQ